MHHGSEDATALVGLDGFVVGAQENIDGELWLHVETAASSAACRGCGVRAVGHGRLHGHLFGAVIAAGCIDFGKAG